MKRISLLLTFTVVFLLPIKKTYAQYYFYDNESYDTPLMYELGASFGVMNCLTDIGGNKGLGGKYFKDLNIGTTQVNGSIYLSATYKEAIGIRIEGSFGNVKAYDSVLAKVKSTTMGRYERNLSFTSRITEISAIAEFYPVFLFINWLARDDYPPRVSPYLMAGVGYFSFNPQTILNGKLVDLQPLRTEGQGFAEYPDRKPYKLQQINFPVGVGFKYDVSPMINLRAEFLYRVLTTDYLDDLSTKYVDPAIFAKYFTGTQLNNAIELSDRRSRTNPMYPVNPDGGQIRGNPKNNDAYFTFNFKVGLTFGREKIKRH